MEPDTGNKTPEPSPRPGSAQMGIAPPKDAAGDSKVTTAEQQVGSASPLTNSSTPPVSGQQDPPAGGTESEDVAGAESCSRKDAAPDENNTRPGSLRSRSAPLACGRQDPLTSGTMMPGSLRGSSAPLASGQQDAASDENDMRPGSLSGSSTPPTPEHEDSPTTSTESGDVAGAESCSREGASPGGDNNRMPGSVPGSWICWKCSNRYRGGFIVVNPSKYELCGYCGEIRPDGYQLSPR